MENKRCYKLPSYISGNFNVVRDNCVEAGYLVVLWNKYYLIVYKNSAFNEPAITESDFENKQVMLYDGHCLCLDNSGSLNINKLESDEYSPGFHLNNDFKIVAAGVITFSILYIKPIPRVYCLKYDENIIKLYVNKCQSSFEVVHVVRLIPDSEYSMKDNAILTVCTINDSNSDIKKIFHANDPTSYILVIICPDRLNTYGCLVSQHTQECRLLKLYESPAEIVDIQVYSTHERVSLVVGLNCGALIKIPLTKAMNKPEVIHLHTTLYKFTLFRDSVIYTDGFALWKMDNMFAVTRGIDNEINLKFQQFFVRNVKDFCIYGKQIICVTFANLVYSFRMNNEQSYILPSRSDIERCSAAQMLSHSETLVNIMDIIEKNAQLAKKINREKEFLTILAVSNRKDIMDEFIQISCTVYDNYNDLVKETSNLFLTDDPSDYCDAESYYFLLKMSVLSIHHKLYALLRNLLKDVMIHVTLTTETVLKTTSIALSEQLKNQSFVISLKKSKVNFKKKLQIHVTFIKNISDWPDIKQSIWKILYEKKIILNAEHFIETHPAGNFTYLKEKVSLSKQICKIAEQQHSPLYNFQIVFDNSDWSFYLQLPMDFKEILSNKNIYHNYLHPKTAEVVLKQNIMNLHLDDTNSLQFKIGDNKVQINILNKDTISLMKVSSNNIMIASDIRNLFSKLIFQTFKSQCRPGKKYIDSNAIRTFEELQKLIQYHQTSVTYEILLSLMSKVQNTIYQLLPI